MNSLNKFVPVLALVFALPWFLLIVCPSIDSASWSPVPYDEDADEMVGEYPPGRLASARGPEVYARNGCAYCHTQMIRPTYAGPDMWRIGWAGREEDGLARSSRARDYFGEKFAYLGVQRHGPDLANVGYRRTDAMWHHKHLFDPRSVVEKSIMPRFSNLYRKREVTGQVSDEAVAVEEEADEEGNITTYEFVPTNDAKALVDYLLSMKKDAKVPESLAATK